jgi:hypothetical protein
MKLFTGLKLQSQVNVRLLQRRQLGLQVSPWLIVLRCKWLWHFPPALKR